MIRFIVFLLLPLYYFPVYSQLFEPRYYPQKEFSNPLKIPISLAANFGELRSNHYHMGLDIRTAHRENLPVFASADGYISKVKIEPFGFGQAVYIRHNNGFVTLYAHLNALYPALASYVKRKQYELQEWNISIELPPALFQVKKGELIAYSGNTGGSQGPHLHFEIRTYPDDINTNPMLFGLPVPDETPPVFRSLSVYDRKRSLYEQSPAFIPVRGSSGHYTTSLPVLILRTPNPGFGISAFDTQSGSANPNGIFQGIIYDNGEVLSGFQMDRISYNDTRGINAHIDYATYQKTGLYYQLLFKMPGYNHSIYREARPGGNIHLEDGSLHEIRVELKDAYGNISNLVFNVRYEASENTSAIYVGKVFYPGISDWFESPGASFYLGSTCLYDSLHITYLETTDDGQEVVSALHHFGNPQVPLADTMIVRIKLAKPVNQKQHVLMEWIDGKDYDVKKPDWTGEWATSSFRNFGDFRLVSDTIPPVIRVSGVGENKKMQKSRQINVFVRDNYKKVKNFRATLDGNWLLFTNDKARAFIYHFDEHCKPGKHELKISAQDEAGNTASLVVHFKR